MLCKRPCSTFKPLGMGLYYIYKMLPDHVAMCHGFCWAVHLDAALCVCRSLRNKLARVGNHSLLQQKLEPEIAALNATTEVCSGRPLCSLPPIILLCGLFRVWVSCCCERSLCHFSFYLFDLAQDESFIQRECKYFFCSVSKHLDRQVLFKPSVTRPVHAAGLRTQRSYESRVTCSNSTCCHLLHQHTFQRADHISTLCVTSLFKPRWFVLCCSLSPWCFQSSCFCELYQMKWRNFDLQKSHTVGSSRSINLNTWESFLWITVYIINLFKPCQSHREHQGTTEHILWFCFHRLTR